MGSKEDKELVAKAAASFPELFGLRAFPGGRFKILVGHSYVSEGKVLLYTGILRGDKWLSFAKGTPEELRKEVISAPIEPATGRTGGDAWREVLHGPVREGPAAAPKPKDLIDEQACAELRFLLLKRMSWIDDTYPHGREDCSTERTAALTALIHLTNELGFDFDDLYSEDHGPAIKQRLEYLRGELRAERISYGELAELQALAQHIDESDVELREAAGIPEQER